MEWALTLLGLLAVIGIFLLFLWIFNNREKWRFFGRIK
jgi:hypothetical protein